MTRKFLAGLALVALTAVLATPADAGTIVMCRPAAPGTAAGPSQFTAPGSSTTYAIDRAGCAPFLITDVGDASANGFIQTGPVRAMILSGATAQAQVGTLPAGGYILGVVVNSESANAPTNGLKFGSTAGGTDIISGILSTAFTVTSATDASIAKRAFSPTQSTAVWVDAVTSWNSTRQIVTVLYSFF